jgi:putative oxidoreductase
MSAGLLILRLVLGGLFAVHGSQKLFGWFGGYSLSGTGTFLEGLGVRPGRLFAAADGLAEFGGGVLLMLGLFGPVAAAAIIAGMLVAILTVHVGNGLLATTNGVELPLLYIASALCLALTGPGAYSIDAALGLSASWTPLVIAIVLLSGVLGGLASLGLRRSAPVVAHA